MDYFGESGIAHTIYKENEEEEWLGLADWPWFNAWCGDIDILGFKKAQSYFRDVVWKQSDLEIAVHEPIQDGMYEYISPWGWPKEYQSWNWQGYEGVPLQVSVYSGCNEVILELNNEAIDTLYSSEFQDLIHRIEIPYQSGMLTAIGIREGKEVARKILETTGKPYQLKITPEKEQINFIVDDLAYFNVEVLDNHERLVPDAEVIISFTVEGQCQLVAVGNSNPQDMKSFQSSKVKTFMGRCQLIVRTCEGEKVIAVNAQAQGLKSATASVRLN
jgi:beta-galactosidase